MTTASMAQPMPAQQMRVARPTNQLDAITQFYCDGLGLEIIGSFTGHDGYDGVMLGLPSTDYHLEFTSYVEPVVATPPTADNLLVFYFDNPEAVDIAATRFASLGHHPVEAENPFWSANGAITVEDPDGWRVVLFPGNFTRQ